MRRPFMCARVAITIATVTGTLAAQPAAPAEPQPTPVAAADAPATTPDAPPASAPATTSAAATADVSATAAMPQPEPMAHDPAATAAPAPATGAPGAAPLKVESANASIKFGLLAQPQFETVGSSTLDGMSHNLFVRRIRLLVGGTLFTNFEYFFDTDYPDLFKANAEGVKNTPGLNIQDALVTWKAVGDQFKIDAGYMLPPLSHNAVQGAGTLYAWEYFANSFRHGTVFGTSANPVGRDLGLQLRGLVADGLVEYRVGMFQGLRRPAPPPVPPAMVGTDVGSTNMFRIAARVQLNLLDPETGFFYAGSYLGTKRILSFGASYDFQDSYKHWSVDGILDMPLGPGALTAQLNVVQWDGDDWIAALPKQTAIMGEAGYRFDDPPLSPIFRFETRSADGDALDETRFGAGLAFWPHGHNINLKAFYTRINPGVGDGYNQFNVQWQLYFF